MITCIVTGLHSALIWYITINYIFKIRDTADRKQKDNILATAMSSKLKSRVGYFRVPKLVVQPKIFLLTFDFLNLDILRFPTIPFMMDCWGGARLTPLAHGLLYQDGNPL